MNPIKYNYIDNIIVYNINDRIKKNIDLKISIAESKHEKNNYFILEWCQDNSTAFGHWVYECCVYVPYYLELKKKIPSLKLYITIKRKFKDIFLEYLGVDVKDIVYSLELPNTCIFHEIISLADNQLSDEYKIVFDNFLNCFPKKYDKTTKMLIMPRQVKENYIGNNRVYNTSQHEELILHLDKSNKILHTDTINELEEQIKIIQNSEIVIITDGSPILVNILFSIDSKVIVLNDTITDNSSKRYTKKFLPMNYIFTKIIEKNKLELIYTRDLSAISLYECLNELSK